MTAAFDTNVLKQVATEIENVKAEYGGVVSEESIDLVAGESLQSLLVQEFRSLSPCSSVGLRGSDFRSSRDYDRTHDSVC
jgi:hypothetical protein